MWVLPFLYYQHAYPLTTFYQEWGAALLSLCALPVLLNKSCGTRMAFPSVVLLPLGMIVLLLLQYLSGKLPSFEQALLFGSYFLWMALLMLLGQRLREALGFERVALVLAVFLVLGTELSALAGILQHYRWHTFLSSVVTVKTASAVYGNIAQPNHFADYIALGLVSIGLLYARYSLRVWYAVLLVSPLLFVTVLSGSRSAWFYFLFVAAMSYLWQRRDDAYLPLFKYALALLLGFAAMHFVVQLPWLDGYGGHVTTVERMFGAPGSGGIRLHLWQEAWLIFVKFPWLGSGFGQFAWQHFQMAAELQNPGIVGLYNNAHNLVMQLAAETGVAGLALCSGVFGLWWWRGRHEPRTLYQWWGYGVLAVLGLHSMLEYPLWYGYFIAIAAVVLGLMENKAYCFKLGDIGRFWLALLLLFATLSLFQLFQGYKKLEAALRPVSGGGAAYVQHLQTGFEEASEYVLLRPYAELFMTGMIEPGTEHLAEKLALNERALHFIPTASLAYRQVWLLAGAGRLPEAMVQLHNALWSYPAEFRAAQAELARFATKDPEHFSALLEFATQKNEEYQRAVSGK